MPDSTAPDGLHAYQWAVSHNSYNTSQQKVIAGKHFDVAAFYDAGFRGVEFDIVQDPHRAEWCVKHGGGFDPRYKLLSSYLVDLRAWSAALRDGQSHEPLFVHLDCKDFTVDAAFPAQLDEYLLTYLGDQPLFTPEHFITEGEELRGKIEEKGWPDPADAALDGRLIFVLSGERAPKEEYAAAGPSVRLCFADRDVHFSFGDRDRVIANGASELLTGGMRFGEWCAEERAVLWRLYVAESKQDFQRFSQLGVHMIAADRGFTLPKKGYWSHPLADHA